MALRGDDLSTGHWKKQRLRVLARDGYTCAYCGEVATEVDHVIPRKEDGGHEMDNLVASCRACNIRKGEFMIFNDFNYFIQNLLSVIHLFLITASRSFTVMRKPLLLFGGISQLISRPYWFMA